MSDKEKEYDSDLEKLKDVIQHRIVRDVIWNEVIAPGGVNMIFTKFDFSDPRKLERKLGKRDTALDMLANVMNADLELGLQMIRENWEEEGEN